MESCLNFVYPKLAWIPLLVISSCISNTSQWSLRGTSSHFNFVTISNSIQWNIVAFTYDMSKSVLDCSVKCSSKRAISFYHVAKTMQCLCNNQTDETIVHQSSEDSITYGFLAREHEIQKNENKVRNVITTGNYESCGAIYDAGFRVNAAYTLYPAGENKTDRFCFLKMGGSWTVFQRRVDGSEDFYRNWTYYVNGFGSQYTEFWLGLEKVHQMTSGQNCELYINLVAGKNNPIRANGFVRYSSFSVEDESSMYTLNLSGYYGNVGNALRIHNGKKFSTYDKNNGPGRNCGLRFKGAWWFVDCLASDLNGVYLGGTHTKFNEGIVWAYPWGRFYSLKETEMMFRC